MNQDTYFIVAIVVMSAATMGLRLAPLLLAKRWNDNALLRYLNLMLPAAIMSALVIYSIKDSVLREGDHGWKEGLCIILVGVVHARLRNPLLSIGLGTAAFMALSAV